MRRRIDSALEKLSLQFEYAAESGTSKVIDSIADKQNDFIETEESGEKWSLLASFIERAWRRYSFIAAIIYGKQGAGKSVYAIKVAYDALKRIGWNVKSTREVYRRYMVFSAYQVLAKVKRAKNSEGRPSRLPVLIWDDAGVHGSSYLFFTDPYLAKAISDSFKVIRTRVASVLFTTPSPRDILKPLRSYDTYIVYVHELDDVWSRAHIYQLRLLPSGEIRVWKLGWEDFKRRLPTYDDYLKIRDKYVDYALEALEKLLVQKAQERLLRQLKIAQALQQHGVSKDEVSLDDIEIEIVEE